MSQQEKPRKAQDFWIEVLKPAVLSQNRTLRVYDEEQLKLRKESDPDFDLIKFINVREVLPPDPDRWKEIEAKAREEFAAPYLGQVDRHALWIKASIWADSTRAPAFDEKADREAMACFIANDAHARSPYKEERDFAARVSERAWLAARRFYVGK